jgi:hypothetical protein
MKNPGIYDDCAELGETPSASDQETLIDADDHSIAVG